MSSKSSSGFLGFRKKNKAKENEEEIDVSVNHNQVKIQIPNLRTGSMKHGAVNNDINNSNDS